MNALLTFNAYFVVYISHFIHYMGCNNSLVFLDALITTPDDAFASILKHGFLNREYLISDSNLLKMLRIK